MSDALTDLARDERRARYFKEYLQKLVCYLKKPDSQERKSVQNAAEKVDSVPRGYWGEQTSLSKKLDSMLENLLKKDKEEWSRLLCISISVDCPQFKEFKELSPFKNKILVYVKYGSGDIRLDGEITEIISKQIKDKNKADSKYGIYAVFLPDIKSTDEIEIFSLKKTNA